MRRHRIRPLLAALAAFPVAALPLAGTAVAQTPTTSGASNPPVRAAAPAKPAQNAPSAVPNGTPRPPDADQNFLTGLRRVGVMAGEVVQCTPEANRQVQISEAMDLADQIAVHFGLRAAFNFVGALGYGSGHPFDKAGCTQASEGWKQIEAKYLGK
ncbi:MAG: hypothetical protein ACREE2_14480 [Stellaceae bacterium]